MTSGRTRTPGGAPAWRPGRCATPPAGTKAIDTTWVNELVDGFGAKPEALVAIFSAVEARYDYLPERALRLISDRMTIHWAQVFGAAGLGGFRLLPAEGHVITVCDCASCRFAGGDRLLAALRDELGIAPGEATDDGRFSLATASDIGTGATSPAVRIDTLVYGPVTAEQALHLVHERRHAATEAAARSVVGAN